MRDLVLLAYIFGHFARQPCRPSSDNHIRTALERTARVSYYQVYIIYSKTLLSLRVHDVTLTSMRRHNAAMASVQCRIKNADQEQTAHMVLLMGVRITRQIIRGVSGRDILIGLLLQVPTAV